MSLTLHIKRRTPHDEEEYFREVDGLIDQLTNGTTETHNKTNWAAIVSDRAISGASDVDIEALRLGGTNVFLMEGHPDASCLEENLNSEFNTRKIGGNIGNILRLFKALRQRFDFIVADLNPTFSNLNVLLIKLADEVIVPLVPERASLTSLKLLKRNLIDRFPQLLWLGPQTPHFRSYVISRLQVEELQSRGAHEHGRAMTSLRWNTWASLRRDAQGVFGPCAHPDDGVEVGRPGTGTGRHTALQDLRLGLLGREVDDGAHHNLRVQLLQLCQVHAQGRNVEKEGKRSGGDLREADRRSHVSADPVL